MGPFPKSRICLIDDDRITCQLFNTLIASWGMECVALTEPPEGCDWPLKVAAQAYLLDLNMPKVNGLELIPHITKFSPDAKTIIITGYADKDVAIEALRRGAFDFLEKPLEPELLRHSLDRALEVYRKDQDLKELVKSLKQSQTELLAHKEQLEYVNSRLIETNKAFSTLARNIDLERDEIEKRIALKLGSIIIPTIERLRRDQSLTKYQMELDAVVKILEDLTSGFAMDAKIGLMLSSTELKVASLIKNGLTTEDIARQLHISTNTVRTHRKNIRRKLKINNASYNLKNYLASKSGGNTAWRD